jgi:hypothetical protein
MMKWFQKILFVSNVRQYAPAKAATIEGMPNFKIISLLAFFPSNVSLKRLLRKCTMAVNAMAISMGKNIANTGTSNVPNPNPENKVSPEPKSATKQMIK